MEARGDWREVASSAMMVDDPDLYGPEDGIPPDPLEVEDAEFWSTLELDLAGPPVGYPSEEVLTGLGMARAGLQRAALSEHDRSLIFEHAVSSGLDRLGELTTQLQVTTYSLLAEALERGLHSEVGLSLVDWMRVRMPQLPKRDATEYAAVADLARRAWARVLGEAMLEGRVALHRAAKVARTMKRLTTSLDLEELEEFIGIATRAACHPEISDQELDAICARLVELLLEEKEPGERERKAWELRRVFKRELGDGLTRFYIDAPSGDAATLAGILTSSLAAPQPEADGSPDMRMPGQRRYDALLTVVRRGLSNPGAPPSNARASLILTLPYDPEKGAPSGPMTTPTGEYVPPRQASLLTCSADITAVLLSEQGEPLALGKDKRYATPGQWKALVARDKHCTYPGCTVPPQWCDSHHLIWWSRDGDTDILNLVLLCGRHHTIVHLNDLTAEIIGGTVVWHV